MMKNTSTQRNSTAAADPVQADPGRSSPTEDVIASIGPKVRQLRRQKNLSLQQLSERSGLSTAAIHKIEHSGMTPTVATLMKLAAALNKSVAYFIDEEECPPAVLVRSEDRKPLFTARDGLGLLAVS